MAFITLTNEGYIDYTLNCLQSLKNIHSNVDLKCYCLGKNSFNILNEKGYNCNLLDEESLSEFQTFRSNKIWSNIAHQKLIIIHENLQKYDTVCITDGDIVYENNNFYNYLLDNLGDNDMLIQSDGMDNAADTNSYDSCCGFMFIKSNPKTIEFFDPKNTELYKDNGDWDEQVYMNKNKHKLRFKHLPLELFPNGRYYYENNTTLQPYMIHFNWIVGHVKKERMLQYNKWFI